MQNIVLIFNKKLTNINILRFPFMGYKTTCTKENKTKKVEKGLFYKA